MDSWFWVWSWGDKPATATRRRAKSMWQAALKEAATVMTPEDTGWTFCVQRCGVRSVYEVEVRRDGGGELVAEIARKFEGEGR